MSKVTSNKAALNAMKPALSPKETRTTTSFFRLTTSITFRTIINAIIIPHIIKIMSFSVEFQYSG